MKKIFNLVPAALGLLALASCSNDEDFFGGDNLAGKTTLTVTIEEEAGTRMNAYQTGFDAVTSNGIKWSFGEGDQIRVYDSKPNAYDIFKYTASDAGNVFAINGKQLVDVENDAYTYALRGEAISYAGWKRGTDAGVPVALVKIPQEIPYSEGTTTVGGKTYVTYTAGVPLWGTVNEGSSKDKLETTLQALGATVAVPFENGQKSVEQVRVRSLKVKDGKKITDVFSGKDESGTTIAESTTEAILVASGTNTATFFGTEGTDFEANADMPLSGWFEAELKTGGVIINTTDEAVNQPATGREAVTVLTTYGTTPKNYMDAYQNIAYLPVAPGTYPILVAEYYDGTNWNFIKAWVGKTINRNVRLQCPKTSFGLEYNLRAGTTTAEITKAMSTYNKGNGAIELNFNVDEDGTYISGHNLGTMNISGYPDLNTISIPALKGDIIVNVYGTAANLSAAPLTITDADGVDNSTSEYGVTFNFEGFATTTNTINLNTTTKVTLVGDYTNVNTTSPLVVTKTGGLTLGTEANAFQATDDATINIADQATPAISAGDITVANTTSALKINNTAVNKVSVGKNVTLVDSKATAVTVTGAATVTTNAPTINVAAAAADVVGLYLNKGVTTINLTGGNITTLEAPTSSPVAFAASSNINVVSSGSSAISCNPSIENVKFNYSSSFDGSKATAMGQFASSTIAISAYTKRDGGSTTSSTTSGFTAIYTAAQLAAAASFNTSNKYALVANITELKNWTSPNLAAPFTVEAGKEIQKLDAPLFGIIQDVANVDGVTITNAAIATDVENAGTGILAKTIAGNVAVTSTSVAGSISGHYYVGGLIGIVPQGATLTLGNGTGTPKAVTTNVAFTNTKTYGTVGWDMKAATWGQFVGTIQGTSGTTSVEIKQDCSTSGTFDKSALYFPYNRTNNGTGTITGYYKGNSTYVGYVEGSTGITLTYGGKSYKTTDSGAAVSSSGVTTTTYYLIGSVNNSLVSETANTATNVYIYNYHNTYEASSY